MMSPAKKPKKSGNGLQNPAKGPEIDVVNPEPTITSALLVAPHAWNKTEGKTKNKDYTDRDYDVRTGHIAKRVAEKIGCKALINWDWRKGDPQKPRRTDERNYNHRPNAKEDTKFLSHLEAVGNQETLVLWIHGIDDDNLKGEAKNKDTGFKGKPEELCALIGYGQHDETPRLTADPKTVVSLTKFLAEHGMKSIPARKTGSGAKNNNQYRAWDKNNMCQWFNQQKDEKGKPKYPNVQSLQIEIKYAGFRDSMECAEKTAEIIENALRKHLGINPSVPATQDDNAVKAKPEEKVDEELVEQAFQRISEIFGKHYYNAMEEVGNYLIETFYGRDFTRAEERRPLKEQSFLQLVNKIQENSGNKPSKTWLYNARDLAVDIHNFKDAVPTYMALGHSHRVILTNVRDKEIKVKLINEAHANNYTVARLRERINEEKEPIKLSLSLKNLPPAKELRKIRLKRLQNFEKKAEEEIKELSKTIKDYQKKIERLKKVIGEKQDGKGND